MPVSLHSHTHVATKSGETLSDNAIPGEGTQIYWLAARLSQNCYGLFVLVCALLYLVLCFIVSVLLLLLLLLCC